jgi:hypothetical protein
MSLEPKLKLYNSYFCHVSKFSFKQIFFKQKHSILSTLRCLRDARSSPLKLLLISSNLTSSSNLGKFLRDVRPQPLNLKTLSPLIPSNLSFTSVRLVKVKSSNVSSYYLLKFVHTSQFSSIRASFKISTASWFILPFFCLKKIMHF